jgi:hypothetical protein
LRFDWRPGHGLTALLDSIDGIKVVAIAAGEKVLFLGWLTVLRYLTPPHRPSPITWLGRGAATKF